MQARAHLLLLLSFNLSTNLIRVSFLPLRCFEMVVEFFFGQWCICLCIYSFFLKSDHIVKTQIRKHYARAFVQRTNSGTSFNGEQLMLICIVSTRGSKIGFYC